MGAKSEPRTTEPDLPEHCSCNQLRRAARYLTRFYDLALAGSGLKSTQYTLLGYLETRGPLTMARLADAMAMDRATIGHNLRPLERDGLVAILPDAKDRRARLISITPHGHDTLMGARPAWRRAQRAFEASFGVGEAAEVRALMVRIVDSPLPGLSAEA